MVPGPLQVKSEQSSRLYDIHSHRTSIVSGEGVGGQDDGKGDVGGVDGEDRACADGYSGSATGKCGGLGDEVLYVYLAGCDGRFVEMGRTA